MRARRLVSGSLVGVALIACSACSGGDTQATSPFTSPHGSSGGSGGSNGGSGGGNGGSGGGSGSGSGGGLGNGNGNGSGDAGSPAVDAGSKGNPADAGSSDSGTLGQPDTSPPTDGFDQFQHRNLDDVNAYRATLGVAPLVLDKQLCDFALAGAQELSQDHLAHQHFIDASNNGTLWSSGFKNSAAENQGDPNGWYNMAPDPTQNELLQIDDIQKAMFNEGPGAGEPHGHYTNIMNPKSKRLGVGLLEVSGQLYLTNDFSE